MSTTSRPQNTVSGSISFVAIGMAKAHVEIAARASLAVTLSVNRSAVRLTATESRRLAYKIARRLLGNWAIDFTVFVPQTLSGSVQSVLQSLKTNTTHFSTSLKKELVNAGANSSAISSFKVTGFSAEYHQQVQVTTTEMPDRGMTGRSLLRSLSQGVLLVLLMARS